MAGNSRPSIDVEGTLDSADWLELYRESLRAASFWPQILVAVGVLLAAAGSAAIFAAPVAWIVGGAGTTLGMLVTYALGYAWAGPRLRWRRLGEAERTARWRISADRLHTEVGGHPLELAWRDVERLRVTSRLLTFELTGGRGTMALPRRAATELGEALILGWAADGGTPVSPGVSDGDGQSRRRFW